MKTDLGLDLKSNFWFELRIKQELENLIGGSSTPPQWGGGSFRAFRRAILYEEAYSTGNYFFSGIDD